MVPMVRLWSKSYKGESVSFDTELNDRMPAMEVKFCDQQKSFEKSIAIVEEPNSGELPLQSKPVDYSKELDDAEIEIKVCDICGDVGRQDLLANCSKCIDGAEHTYCMHVKLDKIPEGDWRCEECMLAEETKKHIEEKLENYIAVVSSRSSSSRTKESIGHLSVHKYKKSLKLGVEGSSIGKIRTNKVISDSYFSSKRPAGILEAILVRRKRVSESIKESGLSIPSSGISLKSSLKNFHQGLMKQTPVNISGNHFSDHTSETGDKSHELLQEYQMSQGSLSNSFRIMDSKWKDPPFEGGISEWNFSRKAVISNNKEVRGVARVMKSMPFSDAISHQMNSFDSEVVNQNRNTFHVEDLKRLKHAKEQSSTDSECTSKFCNPLFSSPVADPGAYAPKTDEKSDFDLELSLGGRKKPVQQTDMLLFGTADSENIQEKPSKTMTIDERDDVESLVPLSLSLALPFSCEEQESKSASETNLLPDRHAVNTLLSL